MSSPILPTLSMTAVTTNTDVIMKEQQQSHNENADLTPPRMAQRKRKRDEDDEGTPIDEDDEEDGDEIIFSDSDEPDPDADFVLSDEVEEEDEEISEEASSNGDNENVAVVKDEKAPEDGDGDELENDNEEDDVIDPAPTVTAGRNRTVLSAANIVTGKRARRPVNHNIFDREDVEFLRREYFKGVSPEEQRIALGIDEHGREIEDDLDDIVVVDPMAELSGNESDADRDDFTDLGTANVVSRQGVKGKK